ncbi:MAG: cobalamin-independent methionine synthase II family protein [Gammaproteobacteria bacterium]|nr:cobalamin-independent methionine synthase II family protein [Gammaproteobacteria bacterium]
MTIEFDVTHVGSLPRSLSLARALITRDKGEEFNQNEFEALVSAELEIAIRRQVESGVTVISDGELGKVGYSTYITERLSGFGGNCERKPALDLAAHPELSTKLAAIMGKQEFTRASCISEVKLVTLAPLYDDIRRFNAAIEATGTSVKAFMNAASPGLISAFQPNEFYATHETYVGDLATAMQQEYEAIVDAGFLLQLDCPDLAMSRHTGFQELTDAEFLRIAQINVEALNHATRNIPAEKMRMHLCWGNYEGPHDHDIALDKIIDIVLGAKPATILFEAANPRHEHEWKIWKNAKLPAYKILAPGLIDTCSNYIEHPELIAQRLERYCHIVGPDRVVAGTDCGFGTFAGYGKIDPEVTWKKLSSLRQGADIAAARL